MASDGSIGFRNTVEFGVVNMRKKSELTPNYYFQDISTLFLLGSFHYDKQ